MEKLYIVSVFLIFYSSSTVRLDELLQAIGVVQLKLLFLIFIVKC